jgi:hypothetical protein
MLHRNGFVVGPCVLIATQAALIPALRIRNRTSAGTAGGRVAMPLRLIVQLSWRNRRHRRRNRCCSARSLRLPAAC